MQSPRQTARKSTNPSLTGLIRRNAIRRRSRPSIEVIDLTLDSMSESEEGSPQWSDVLKRIPVTDSAYEVVSSADSSDDSGSMDETVSANESVSMDNSENEAVSLATSENEAVSSDNSSSDTDSANESVSMDNSENEAVTSAISENKAVSSDNSSSDTDAANESVSSSDSENEAGSENEAVSSSDSENDVVSSNYFNTPSSSMRETSSPSEGVWSRECGQWRFRYHHEMRQLAMESDEELESDLYHPVPRDDIEGVTKIEGSNNITQTGASAVVPENSPRGVKRGSPELESENESDDDEIEQRRVKRRSPESGEEIEDEEMEEDVCEIADESKSEEESEVEQSTELGGYNDLVFENIILMERNLEQAIEIRRQREENQSVIDHVFLLQQQQVVDNQRFEGLTGCIFHLRQQLYHQHRQQAIFEDLVSNIQ
jgi:hypothetical protein